MAAWTRLPDKGLKETGQRWVHQQVDCEASDSPGKTLPLWFPVLSAPMQSMIKPKHDQTHGRGKTRLVGTGPPPGCSALALVSTWLCPLSASQRAAEWGSIETNSLCRTQLMGLPRVGKKGTAAGLWLLILPHKHARNLPPGICPCDNNKSTPFQTHLLFCTHMDTS